MKNKKNGDKIEARKIIKIPAYVPLNIPDDVKGQLPIILKNEIQEHVDELIQLEGENGKIDYKRWTNLFSIYCKFQKFGESANEEWDFQREFYSFVCERFDFQKSQAYLYIKAARCMPLRDAKISISRAEILMGSHSDHAITKFRSTHSDELISSLTCRKLKAVLNDFLVPKKLLNSKKGDTGLGGGHSSKNPKLNNENKSKPPVPNNRTELQATIVRKHLETAFSEVKDYFSNKDLTPQICGVFNSMFQWKAKKDWQKEAA